MIKVSLVRNGRGATDEAARDSQSGALDVLASQVVGAKVNREAVEGELERLPRWRFLRRAELEREVERSRKREARLLGLYKDV